MHDGAMSNPQDAYGPPGQPPGPPPDGWQQPPAPPPGPPGPPPQQPGWGGQGQWGGPPGPPPKSNLPLILGIVAVVVVVAGAAIFVVLSGDDDDTVTVAPEDLTEEDVEALLLQTDDVSDEFSETYRGEEQEDDSDEVDVPTECDDAMTALEDPEGDDDVNLTVEYAREDEGEITHIVGPIREGDPTADDFVSAVQESCSGSMEVTNADGQQMEMALEAEWVDGLGDDAFALTVSIDHEIFRDTVEAYAVYVFQDGIFSSVSVSSGFDLEQSTAVELVPNPPDEDLARDLSEIVVGRIQDMD